ncbi:MAG TPA: peptidoglycan DD-metalloendopeptidase family protein [Nocardioides sp.]|nr:peptidoglycan DD-metalloendopeptidase family protein [Nocardioides sp.]
MRHSPHPLLRGAVAVVLGLLLVLAAPAAGLDGPADSTDTDPVGVWPLVPEPEVVDGFDPPDSPYGAGHRGVDLAGAPGQPVRTALPGTVTYVGPLAGRGVVVVGHGPTRTTYEPVTASVSVGDVLAAGARIGTLQVSGSHCFPRACLHWGWIRADTYLDPLRLVGAGPVRLLPLWRDDPVGAGITPVGAPVDRPFAAFRW